jgi:hypothetical protein
MKQASATMTWRPVGAVIVSHPFSISCIGTTMSWGQHTGHF